MDGLILILVGTIGSTLTYFVNIVLKQGPVRSSAVLTLLVSGFFYFFPTIISPYLTSNIPVVFIGASFIGMVSRHQLSTYAGLILAGIVFSIIYLNTSRFFSGYGGSLGTSACISLLAVLSIPYFKSPKKLTVGLLLVRNFLFKSDKKQKRRSSK